MYLLFTFLVHMYNLRFVKCKNGVLRWFVCWQRQGTDRKKIKLGTINQKLMLDGKAAELCLNLEDGLLVRAGSENEKHDVGNLQTVRRNKMALHDARVTISTIGDFLIFR